MKRSELREQVFQLLFRVEFNTPEEMREQEDLFIETNDIEGEDFSDYADYEVEAIYANLEQLVIEIKRY